MGISEISKEPRNRPDSSAAKTDRTGCKALKDFSKHLSTDRHLAVLKKKPKKLKLEKREAVNVELLQKLREPVTVWVVNHNYTRSFMHENLASESYIRNNLGVFVRGVRAVLMRLLPEIYGARIYRGPENTMRRLEDACRDPDTLLAGDFAREDGTELKINKAFANAIRQFFKDEAFARNVCRIAISDYLAGKEIEKKVKAGVQPLMKQ